jgi:hypothetical protein
MALIVAIAAYAVDCAPISNPADAMHCCGAMPCHTHGSAQDCCKTMSVVHLPFVQAAAAPQTVLSHLALAAVTVMRCAPNGTSSSRLVSTNSHAPPDLAPRFSSLRI